MLKYVLPLIFIVRPSTVYDLLRRRLGEIIPLNRLLGIEIVSIGDGVAEARLPFRTELTNHIGSVHATAIFGLAEAASGGAMSGALAPVIMNVRPVAASAKVTFTKVARTELVAHAMITGSAAELRATLAQMGKIVFDVAVSVRDSAGADVAQVTVVWHATNK
jgi:uncharacterized protein (TIGR00369 family)